MASGWTNKGKYNLLAMYRGGSMPANFYMRLFTWAATPDADSNTAADLTEIADGNGYTQGTGYTVNLDATDFDTITEDDGNDRALVQLKDLVFTAAGGNLPSGGDGARWACVLGATGAAGEIWHFFDLVSDRTVSTGQTLTLQDCELRLDAP